LGLIFPEGKPVANSELAGAAASYANAFQQVGDERADRFVKLIETYIGEQQPEDFTARDALYVGAAEQILTNNPKGAYEWLEQGLKTGAFSRNFFEDPVFDVVRETTEFAIIVTRNDENLAKHRVAIEQQLANPDPKWVMPETGKTAE